MTITDLSIVTITYNNEEELKYTYESLQEFRGSGGSHIIVNGGRSVKKWISGCELIEEADKGIYDALNKGISRVESKYFMLIHSGDALVSNLSTVQDLLQSMNKQELDILLNDCSIEFGQSKRLMKSKKWKPWMFKLGAQPPHPPTIYRSNAVKHIQYDLEHPVIADFQYLEKLFNSNLKWAKGNKLLIHMSAGGATSSGVKSFFYVNKQFRKLKGPVKMFWFALARPLIKVYQMF